MWDEPQGRDSAVPFAQLLAQISTTREKAAAEELRRPTRLSPSTQKVEQQLEVLKAMARQLPLKHEFPNAHSASGTATPKEATTPRSSRPTTPRARPMTPRALERPMTPKRETASGTSLRSVTMDLGEVSPRSRTVPFRPSGSAGLFASHCPSIMRDRSPMPVQTELWNQGLAKAAWVPSNAHSKSFGLQLSDVAVLSGQEMAAAKHRQRPVLSPREEPTFFFEQTPKQEESCSIGSSMFRRMSHSMVVPEMAEVKKTDVEGPMAVPIKSTVCCSRPSPSLRPST